MSKYASVCQRIFVLMLLLGWVLSACTPSPNQSTTAFGIQAKKDPPGQHHKPKAKNRLPVATSYTVGSVDVEDPGLANPGDFGIQAYPINTACYDCRWSELSLNASYVAASFAPGSDSLSIDHPELNNADWPNNSGYHFTVNPTYGTTTSGKKIATRLRVFMRVQAYRRDNIVIFGRSIATGYIDFISTDGIHYSFEQYNSLYAAISANYSEVTDPNPANYCGRRISNSGTTNLPKTIEIASLTLDEAKEQAQIQVVMRASARAQIFNSACSASTTISGTNTAVFNVTADLKFEDEPIAPEPSPSPTPTPTANPDPEPTPSPSPSSGTGASPSPSPSANPSSSPDPSADPGDGDNGGGDNGPPDPEDCLNQIVPPAALAPLMSDLNGLSGGGFSTQSLSASDLQRFAQLKEHPPQQAAQKAQLKAQLLAQLDQLDARLAALQQRSAEDFDMLYGPYAGPVRESAFLQYKTMADEAAEHVAGHLASQNSHALFYASQAYLNEVSLLAHVTRRYLNGTLNGLNPNQTDDFAYYTPQTASRIETVPQLIQYLEHNTTQHLNQLQQQYQQLSADFERLKVEEAKISLELDAMDQQIAGLLADYAQIEASMDQLDAALSASGASGGFGIQNVPDEIPDAGPLVSQGVRPYYPNTHSFAQRYYSQTRPNVLRSQQQRQQLQTLRQNQSLRLNRAESQINQLQTQIKQTSNPVVKNNLQAQLNAYRQLTKNLKQQRNRADNNLKSLERSQEKAQKNRQKQEEQGSACRAAELKMISKSEEKALKNAGYDIHGIKKDIVGNKGAHYDLYKDHNGDIFVMPKGNPRGAEPQPTWLNIRDIMGVR